MRILVDYRPALRDRTGVGEYLHQVAHAVTASPLADESLTLFSSSWKDRLDREAVPGAQVVDAHIPVRLLNFAWHRLGWPPVEMVTGQSFDVVQSGHPLLTPARGAAQSVLIADLDFLDRPEMTRAEVRRDYPALAGEHARRAHRVIVISNATRREVEARLGVPADRITVAYPGVPDWPRRPIEPSGGCILFLGTLEPRKNLDVLLDAYARLLAVNPHAPRLVLAGGVPPEAAALVARASETPFAGRVDITGYVDSTTRLDWYRRALVFVLPSHSEGFGMPVAEAMRIGVPVIVSNRGALPELVGDAGRLVDPDDAGALAAVLDEVLRNPAARGRMSDAGVARSRQFTWTATAAHIRDGWAQAVEERKRRG